MKVFPSRLWAALMGAAFMLALPAAAQTLAADAMIGTSTPSATSDLSLSHFFSEGWDQPWVKYPRGEGTPDMSLLRVQTNILAQIFRLDTAFQFGKTSPAFSQGESVTALVEYALNRRFMPGLYINHQWLKGRNESDDEDGTAGGLFTRFQLLENRDSSVAMTLKMALPNHDLGEHLTTWSYALAGWSDLQPLGLHRTGLYYHVQHEIIAGPSPVNAMRNAFTYDLSLAHTWSSGNATLQNFTTFLEGFARTAVDGTHAGRTTLSLTPGFRFTLAHRHALMFGLDIPLTHPRTEDGTCRFSWIASF